MELLQDCLELMVLVQFFYNDKNEIELLMNFLKENFTQITSLLYTVNSKANNTIYDQEIICYSGLEYITEKIEDLSFKIGPKSFFQTNSDQAEILYKSARKLAKISKSDIVYDLYTGTGTIAQFISSNAKKVIGIDSVPEAIKAATESAKNNNIHNCSFLPVSSIRLIHELTIVVDYDTAFAPYSRRCCM